VQASDANYQKGRSYPGGFSTGRDRVPKSLGEPGNAEAPALGVIYASQGKYEQAVTELKAALAPTGAAHHNNLGYALLQGGTQMLWPRSSCLRAGS
jgi:hypothetical protein